MKGFRLKPFALTKSFNNVNSMRDIVLVESF